MTYSGYDFLDHREEVRHAGCLAHVRRKFMDPIKAQGNNRPSGSADQALAYIQQFYGLEKQARQRELSADEILTMRREQARPTMEQFHQWLSKRSGQTPPKGLLGKAISYALNQWDRLQVYLEEPLLTPDNNPDENAKGIKANVLTRKVSYLGRLSPHLEQMGLLPALGRNVITSAGGPESRHWQES